MRASFNTRKKTLAAADLLLVAPAALFMLALVVRNLPPLDSANKAQEVVMWYAGRPWTLWALLIALPLTAFITGLVTLLQRDDGRALGERVRQTSAAIRTDLSTFLVAMATVMAGGILLVVAAHMAMN